MKLRKIELYNFKRFENLTILFEEKLTVIVGKNGAGKSSVLKAVSIVLSWFIARLKSEKGNGMLIPEVDIMNGKSHAYIKAFFDDGKEVLIPNKAKRGIPKKYSSELNDWTTMLNDYRHQFEETDFKCSVPVIAYYGVRRAVIDVPLRIRNTEYNLLDAYKDCLNGSANFRDFFTWFRNQEDAENYAKVNGGGSYHPITRELDTLRTALSRFMPGYTGLTVVRNPLRMIIKKDGTPLNVAQLSDGEQIYLALIGDLCHRLVLANPTLPDPLDGDGIVMIDEVDLHLHPEWQSVIGSRLGEVFPNIQFIITTHSPHVINRVPTESLRIFDNSLIESADYGYGLPSQIVLKDIMGLSADEPQVVSEKIAEIYASLNAGEINSAKEASAGLENMAPGHPELVRMRKIIERLERR